MKRRAAILAIFTAVSIPRDAGADYDPPTFEEIARQATAIVDATVVELTDAGHAQLRIHQYLKGEQAPETLTGIALTCVAELPDVLKERSRYVLCLHEDQLFEELTFYLVRERDGEFECHYRDSRSGEAEWMAIARFAEKLETAIQDAESEVLRSHNAHETVEAFLTAVQTGALETASTFFHAAPSEEERAHLAEHIQNKECIVFYALASTSGEVQEAIVVVAPLSDEQPQLEVAHSAKLVFTLSNGGDRWKIASAESKSSEAVYQAGAQFQTEFPDAEIVRARIGENEDILAFTSRDYVLRQLVEQHQNSGEKLEDSLQDIPRPWTVSEILEHYDGETSLDRRCQLLWLLAMSRDPRGAVVVGEGLSDRSIEPLAAYLLLDTQMPIEASIGGTEQHISAAHDWWAGNQERLRAEARELESHR